MTRQRLAPKTIANVHGLFSAAMTTAVRLGYREDNPCAGVELPKSQATHDEMTVLTRDEFALLLSKVSPFYQPLVLCSSRPGCGGARRPRSPSATST